MSTISPTYQSTVIVNGVSLPKYNTNEFRDLPADAAPEGVLADGGIYYNAYAMLTPSDTAMLQAITGQKSLQGNPLAAAIGTDRADVAIGWGPSLTGDLTVSYLQSIETALANPHSGGTYDGFQISSSELNAAIDYVKGDGENSGETSSVSVSA